MDRRILIRDLTLGMAGFALGAPILSRAAGQCDANNQCSVGILSEVFQFFAASQHHPQWCWAACMEMVLRYHGIPITQEEIVLRIKGAFKDEAASPIEIIAALNGWTMNAHGKPVVVQSTALGITVDNILTDLYQDRPLLLGYNTGMGGHAVVLTGMSYAIVMTPMGPAPYIQTITVRDPWPENPSKQVWNAQELAMRTNFMARIFVTHFKDQ